MATTRTQKVDSKTNCTFPTLPVIYLCCAENLRLERTLKTIESNQHLISFLYSLSRWWLRAAGWPWQQYLLPCLSACIDNGGQLSPSFGIFLNPIMQAETKGEISACGGTVERGEFVHNTHNETPHWLEQCCDTDIAV